MKRISRWREVRRGTARPCTIEGWAVRLAYQITTLVMVAIAVHALLEIVSPRDWHRKEMEEGAGNDLLGMCWVAAILFYAYLLAGCYDEFLYVNEGEKTW